MNSLKQMAMATTGMTEDEFKKKYLMTVLDFSFMDHFCSKDPSHPPCFQVKRVPDDDLFLEQLETPVPDHTLNPDMKSTINNQVASLLCNWPEKAWGQFGKHAVCVAATVLFTLLPNYFLYFSANHPMREAQVNQLWGQLLQLREQRAPFRDACNLIMGLLTTHTQTYSSVTESDVSLLLRFYYSPNPSFFTFRRFYMHFILKNQSDNDKRFKDIKEVVDSIESPPILKADDHTRLLMKISTREADVEYLLSKVKLDIFPCSGQECLPDLKRSFDYLLFNVIDTVIDLMTSLLASLLPPLNTLYGMRVPREISGLVKAAEIRRIALGSRFISRNHLLWAFYECGLVLPPQIRETIEFNSDEEDHPPYHIYLAAIKLAERFSEKLRLENFIFAVIHSKDIGISGDQMIDMESCYKKFLTALDSSSVSCPGDVGALPRIHSGEFK